MPIYEICCDTCGYAVEQFTHRVENLINVCQECGGDMRQRYYPPALFMGAMPMSGHRKWSFPNSDSKKP
jgi:putative FmdB family regulatory protein